MYKYLLTEIHLRHIKRFTSDNGGEGVRTLSTRDGLQVNTSAQDIPQNKHWVEHEIWLKTKPLYHHLPSQGEG